MAQTSPTRFRLRVMVKPNYKIVLARPQDLRHIPDIELAAVTLLEAYAPESVQVEVSSGKELKEAQTDGRLWVALSGETPVGFAHVLILKSGLAHLEELDVHPNHGRRGLGTLLVRKVFDWVTCCGYATITLTTFREPPFNMPFYRRLGFEELPQASFTPELQAIVDHEASRGLDPQTRVVMIWRSL